MNYAVEPSEAAGMSARRLERIRPAMQAYVDRGVYPGINTLIARRGKVVHAGEFGWRDKEAGSPMTADTIFRLYSMTKPIVCVALITLLEEGQLQADRAGGEIHSGLRRREGLGGGRQSGRSRSPGPAARLDDPHQMYSEAKIFEAKCSLEAAIDDLARLPLAFQPGSRWRYSVGIDVAARVMKVKAHPTRSRPRNLVFSCPAMVLIQPKASSIRLRMRWLTA